MISSIGRSPATELQPRVQETKPDALAEHRAKQNQDLVSAALQAEHKQKVQAAVEAHLSAMNQLQPNASASLSQVQNSYGEF